jgi:hypothetical protein
MMPFALFQSNFSAGFAAIGRKILAKVVFPCDTAVALHE